MPKAEDEMACDGCKRTFPARLLDAVLLDEDGNEASAEAYCERCFPRFKRVAGDTWKPLYTVD